MLEEARIFESQGRPEAAGRAARRGLDAAPDSAKLLRTLARIESDLGHPEEAERLRRRADALDPAPPPPPDVPLAARSDGVLVLLPAPDPETSERRRVPDEWPDARVAPALERRLRLRLPAAQISYFEPDTLADARRRLAQQAPGGALSLTVERAFCESTVKDGRFAVAWLRVAAGRPGTPGPAPAQVRHVVDEPRLPGGCVEEAVARALESALALPAVERVLTSARPADRGAWAHASVRALFPGLGRRLREALAAGRRRLAQGRLAEAREAFARAAEIDPEDPEVLAFLRETDATRALARELSPTPEGGDVLEPRFTPAQRAAYEAQLREERRRREELRAALAVLDEDLHPPPAGVLRALRPWSIRDPEAVGPALARQRAGAAVEARAAYAPDGEVISVYFFPEGEALPVLREEDTDGDGRPDRWIGYTAGLRREIWEDTHGAGRPGVHLFFDDTGRELVRAEFDRNADGRTDRVFDYADGALVGESLDRDHDGVLDTFDRLDAEGERTLREEDVDGDGRIDVRSTFERGKLTRREILDVLDGDGP
jgi:tetratricopeptide (TPR) repeat protein